jgi:2-polyprenyl-6-methoxyphenol hydroxylase-like FAD-dependent oxidoreductase
MIMSNTSVLIIGAGPTGLTLACELARRNISIRIIERSDEYPKGSRAKGLQPRSLEVFDDLDIAGKAMQAGSTDFIFRRFNGNQSLGDVHRPIFQRNDTQYAQGLLIPQWKVEEILREKLSSFNVRVELATELVRFSQNNDTVMVVLKTPSGINEMRCDYMVGCDGGKSSVRKSLGIKFEGETHEDEKALIGDVEVDGLTPDAWHVWMHPQYAFVFALCPFKCTSSWQLQTLAAPDENGEIPEPNLETFNRLFQERAQMPEVKLKNATWQSLYRVNVRMADQYRVGRVFIAGDAAHVHSIAGGLGMNTGIQDAYNLGWKIAAVLNQNASPALLDTYEEERLPIAAWTLNISSERQQVMADSVKQGGDAGLHTTATKDTTQLNLNYRYSSLSENLNKHEGSLQAGDRAPDVRFQDGSWLFDLCRGTHFTILGFGTAQETIDNINGTFSGDVKAFLIKEPQVAKAFGNINGLIVIRPDGYIGMTAGSDDEIVVEDYLEKFLSPAESE